MDYISNAARHRILAGQYRAMAQRSQDEQLRARYRGIADAFDALAMREEELAQRRDTSN
jgi:hypothetical protein